MIIKALTQIILNLSFFTSVEAVQVLKAPTELENTATAFAVTYNKNRASTKVMTSRFLLKGHSSKSSFFETLNKLKSSKSKISISSETEAVSEAGLCHQRLKGSKCQCRYVRVFKKKVVDLYSKVAVGDLLLTCYENRGVHRGCDRLMNSGNFDNCGVSDLKLIEDKSTGRIQRSSSAETSN